MYALFPFALARQVIGELLENGISFVATYDPVVSLWRIEVEPANWKRYNYIVMDICKEEEQ